MNRCEVRFRIDGHLAAHLVPGVRSNTNMNTNVVTIQSPMTPQCRVAPSSAAMAEDLDEELDAYRAQGSAVSDFCPESSPTSTEG